MLVITWNVEILTKQFISLLLHILQTKMALHDTVLNVVYCLFPDTRNFLEGHGDLRNLFRWEA